MSQRLYVQLHIAAAGGGGLVFERDGLLQRVARHHTLELAEQVGGGKFFGLGGDEQLIPALVDDVRGGIGGKGGDGQAQRHHQRQQEGKHRFTCLFHRSTLLNFRNRQLRCLR